MRPYASGHPAIRASRYAWGTCNQCKGGGEHTRLIFSQVISLDVNPATGKPFGIVDNPKYDAAPDIFLNDALQKDK